MIQIVLNNFKVIIGFHCLQETCANVYIYAGASIKPKSKQDIEVDAKMEEILTNVELSAYSVRFIKEKISPDILCKLSIEDFHNLGINPFWPSVTFLYLLKVSENLWFSDVFKGYRNVALD